MQSLRCCWELPSSGQVDYLARPYYQWKYYAPWIQDDIKLTRRLTINLGLRWDITSPVTEKYDRINRGFLCRPGEPDFVEDRPVAVSRVQGVRRHQGSPA